MYYRSVDELPFKTLFKIFETNDTLYLVKKYEDRGKVSKKDVNKTWEKIEQEYRKFDGSRIVERVLKVSQKIDFFKAKHEMVSLCVLLLRFGRNMELESRLARAGYRVGDGDFENELDSIESNAKGLQTRIGIKESELEKLTGDDEVVKSDLNQMLARMSSELGIAFKFNEITVVEFFGYKDALENKVKRQQ